MKQITLPDTRFYQVDDEFYPSVTSVLAYWPKNPAFYEWLKDVGRNADTIMKEAGMKGTASHNAIEEYLKTGKSEYKGPSHARTYQDVNKFDEFWNMAKPKLLYTEVPSRHDVYKYAGTVDLVLQVGEEVWVIDIKTSKNMHESYYGQLTAYKKAIEDDNIRFKDITKVDRVGILWLNASTRGPSKKPDIYQGDGWKLIFVEEEEKYWQGFLNAYFFYKLYNPEPKPKALTLPPTLTLKKYE